MLFIGWVPKKNLIGLDSRVYILDFFGSQYLKGRGLKVPPSRFLTAFGAEGNTFLGYFVDNSTMQQPLPEKQNKGVIWGKDAKHLQGKEHLLRSIADDITLVSTATNKVFQHRNVIWAGHQTPTSWMDLLAESKFMIGLGNPILGPSAIDAISVGCMFLNPIFDKPVHGKFISQHPFAQKLGPPYVCSYRAQDLHDLRRCVAEATKTQLHRFLPPDFHLQNYLQRVRKIFS